MAAAMDAAAAAMPGGGSLAVGVDMALVRIWMVAGWAMPLEGPVIADAMGKGGDVVAASTEAWVSSAALPRSDVEAKALLVLPPALTAAYRGTTLADALNRSVVPGRNR